MSKLSSVTDNYPTKISDREGIMYQSLRPFHLIQINYTSKALILEIHIILNMKLASTN